MKNQGKYFKVIVFFLISLLALPGLAFAKKAKTKLRPKVEQKVEDQVSAQTYKAVDILPSMSSTSGAPNQVWAGAFQLVWNDAVETLGKPVSSRALVSVLNGDKGPVFTQADLSAAAFYVKHGVNTLELKQNIEEGIFKKFKEKSEILDRIIWNGRSLIFYSMLKKDFTFRQEFEDMGKDTFGNLEKPIEYFGAKTEAQKKSVVPLFYQEDEFAVRLESNQNDEIYLYRTDREGTLEELYQSMMGQRKHTSSLKIYDQFKAPRLKFTEIKDFLDDLKGVTFPKGGNISVALESINFNMDKKGVKLVAEAILGVSRGGIMMQDPRKFIFNKRYVIFIQEKGKKPYFAMLVEDPTKLQ